MTPEQFTYWLQGFTELNGNAQPTPEQWKSITEHLQTVFVKVTPPVSDLQRNREFSEHVARAIDKAQRQTHPPFPRTPDLIGKLGQIGQLPYTITCWQTSARASE